MGPKLAAQKAARNEAIVAYYRRGFSFRETGSHFRLDRETVRLVVKKIAPEIIRPHGDTRSNSTGKASMSLSNKDV